MITITITKILGLPWATDEEFAEMSDEEIIELILEDIPELLDCAIFEVERK
ncbi:MAG: hypothetical protein LUO93_05955 [Methanomicrobiales archaeon]|nr:hypothetical protein [Methanomicrobiales archaeon]